ncbi:hypothetical protein [Haloarchaeobius sp. TZWWS8]|uniref:hypothetical protein n=1 Tax=Haloarchaeobius sp. TZWWS8 TaxID=3446121 RepID=UPI003EB6EBD0
MPADTERQDEYSTLGVDAVDIARYVAITLSTDEVLLFDEQCSAAWIQANNAVSIEEAA